MEQEVKAAVEQLAKDFESFKEANDLSIKELKKGVADPVLDDKISKIQDSLDLTEKTINDHNAEQKKLQDKIDELETTLARGPIGTEATKQDLELREGARHVIMAENFQNGRNVDIKANDIEQIDLSAYAQYLEHFDIYLRKGYEAYARKMRNVETKLLSVDRDPGGGYWVKPETSSRIMTIVNETSPVRQFATVENIGTDALEIMVDENLAGFGWVGEQESRAETTTPDIGVRSIPAHEVYAEPRATQKLLDDAGFNVESWLNRKVAERFALAEAAAHVTGTGNAQPRGFTTYPSGTSAGQIEQIASGTSGAVTMDGLFDLIYSLKAPYRSAARFMMARLTIRDVRKLKDGQGQYLWQPNNQQGEPALLAGFPVSQADDMAAVAASALAIAFGDFGKGYTIVDRLGIRTLRDPYTTKPYIKFYTTRRTGGAVTNFEAIKLQILDA